MNPPGGCPFHPRCPHAIAECARIVPALENLDADRQVSCIRAKEIN
jgi:oligopeptide/dipeptide ABC transporter ATP-binding protein